MTRRPGSLAAQLVFGLFVVQAVCILAAMIVFPIVAPFTTYRSISDRSARKLVAGSIERDAAGNLHIVPTAALSHYAKARPGFAYAVRTAGGKIISGSSAELASFLERYGTLIPLREDAIKFARANRTGDAVFVSSQFSPHGYLALAIAGDEFHADDIPTFLQTFLPAILPAYGPILLGMLAGIPLVLRLRLGPVRRAAAAASLIDIRSLDRRLPLGKVQREFEPLVQAINEALERVAEGWDSQRLFTANAAHELRTPVTVLQARVKTLPMDAPLRGALVRDVRRLALLIDQLLAIARLERRDAKLQPVELVALARGVVADWAPVAISSGLSIGFSTDVSECWVAGDQQTLEGAIAALIDNALKVEPHGHGVEVSVDRSPAILVTDHGPGIEPGDREAIFEPFWRKREDGGGSGLGLATVRQAARLHGGEVSVSAAQGGGAAFRLSFPNGASKTNIG